LLAWPRQHKLAPYVMYIMYELQQMPQATSAATSDADDSRCATMVLDVQQVDVQDFTRCRSMRFMMYKAVYLAVRCLRYTIDTNYLTGCTFACCSHRLLENAA
jgi:hypothetical protein